METTMIQIKKDTAKMLKELKKYNRQSYDEIIRVLLGNEQPDALTQNEMQDIKEALKDVESGRVHKIEVLAKTLGIKLKG